MNYSSLPDDVLERHLHAEPNNINMIMEAARRFSGVSERADDADTFEHKATGELDDLKSEAEGLRDELKDVEAERDELQADVDRLTEQLATANDVAETLGADLKLANDYETALRAEVERLSTVLDMVADV